MYELNDDDTLYYNDKTTGEKVVVGSISSEDDDDDEEDQDYEGDDNDDDLFAGLTDSERLEAISKMLLSEEVRLDQAIAKANASPSYITHNLPLVASLLASLIAAPHRNPFPLFPIFPPRGGDS